MLYTFDLTNRHHELWILCNTFYLTALCTLKNTSINTLKMLQGCENSMCYYEEKQTSENDMESKRDEYFVQKLFLEEC